MLSQIENISVISMKGQNNTVILEGASNRVYYTSDSYNKNKENMRKYGYRALRKARLKIHHKC